MSNRTLQSDDEDRIGGQASCRFTTAKQLVIECGDSRIELSERWSFDLERVVKP